MNAKEQLLEAIQEQRDTLATAEIGIALIPDDLEVIRAHIGAMCYPNRVEFWFSFPANKTSLAAAVRAFRNAGWQRSNIMGHWFCANDGTHRYEYYQKFGDGKLAIANLVFSTEAPDATCHRYQVGVKEEPIYKVECHE